MKAKEETIKIGAFQPEELAGQRVLRGISGFHGQGSSDRVFGAEGIFVTDDVNSDGFRLFIEYHGDRTHREAITQKVYDRIRKEKNGYSITV